VFSSPEGGVSRGHEIQRVNDEAEAPLEVTEDDEPADDDAPLGRFDLGAEDETAAPAPSWLGALGQMIAALLVVVALVAAFIGAAAILRRLVP
jgi:hypothetical protein